MNATSVKALGLLVLTQVVLGSACVVADAEGPEVEEDFIAGSEDGKEDSGRVSPPCRADGELSLSACALLGTLAYAEGTGARYNITFGFREFTSYDDHPRISVCSRGLCSTAAGRYQILAATWDGIRSGLSDFSPSNQDAAALKLLRGRGVTNVDSIDTYAEFRSAIYKLNREWASLPGSPYGQPTYSLATLWAQFQRLRGN